MTVPVTSLRPKTNRTFDPTAGIGLFGFAPFDLISRFDIFISLSPWRYSDEASQVGSDCCVEVLRERWRHVK